MLLGKLASRTPTSTILKAHYATASGPTHDHWPRTSPPHSPYQILNVDRRVPYSKEYFNELVKLYHPDRTSHPSSHVCAHLTQTERLERYRLIVAAHAILSDPARRKAYDTSGLGWAGSGASVNEVHLYRKRTSNGTWGNATWEDWEEFYSKNAKHGSGARYQKPYVSNKDVVTFFIVLTFLGGAVQWVHAENMTASRLALRDERHFQALRDLEKAKETARSKSRESRIEDFVRQRDAAVMNNPGLLAMVTKPDICDSGDALGRSNKELDMRRKWKNRPKED
jgi:curved DNA-binding protein CbpA